MEPQDTPIPPKPPTLQMSSASPAPQVKNSLVLIMSVLLIIAVAIAGLFYFQIQKLSKELSKYQTQPSPTPSSTPDPTVGWKTYVDPKGQYSFRYPKLWVLNHPSDEQIQICSSNSSSETNCLTLTSSSLSLDQFIFEMTSAKMTVLAESPKNTNIGSNQSKAFIISSTAGPYEIKSQYYLFESNLGRNVFVSFFIPTNETFDQILSTFKFIEATPSASPTATPASSQ